MVSGYHHQIIKGKRTASDRFFFFFLSVPSLSEEKDCKQNNTSLEVEGIPSLHSLETKASKQKQANCKKQTSHPKLEVAKPEKLLTTSTHQTAFVGKWFSKLLPDVYNHKSSLDMEKATYFFLTHLKSRGQLHKDIGHRGIFTSRAWRAG